MIDLTFCWCFCLSRCFSSRCFHISREHFSLFDDGFGDSGSDGFGDGGGDSDGDSDGVTGLKKKTCWCNFTMSQLSIVYLSFKIREINI